MKVSYPESLAVGNITCIKRLFDEANISDKSGRWIFRKEGRGSYFPTFVCAVEENFLILQWQEEKSIISMRVLFLKTDSVLWTKFALF